MRRGAVRLVTVLYGLGFVLLGVILGSLSVRGYRQLPADPDWPVPGGDARRGAEAVVRHGCISCHEISGVPAATGRVGPRLTRLREQSYIAGRLPNVTPNLVRWIMNPRAIDPQNVMPDLPVTEAEARDIAALLYSQ